MGFNMNEVNNHLERATQLELDFCTAFDEDVKGSYRRKLDAMQPGDTVPEGGKFFTDEERTAFKSKAAQFSDMIAAELDKAEESVNAAIAAAPTAEATNYINVLAARANVTETEINAALDKYGDNYAAYNAIKEIGEKHKVYSPEHPANAAQQEITARRKDLYNITLQGAESKRITRNAVLFAQALRGN